MILKFIFKFLNRTFIVQNHSKTKIFAGKTLNMMILSSLVSSPRNVLSIPAFYLKNFFDRKHPLYGFFQKNFSTEILKILQKVAPIGF